MNKTIDKLYNRFLHIQKLGWIKSVKNGNASVGRTFEDLIGIPENNFEIPDFNGIEIKTKRQFSNSYTTLFNATPDGPHFHEIERLRLKYGYPHSKMKQYKVLNVSIFANEDNKIGLNYYFKLEVNKSQQKVFLLIYDKNRNLIENEVFWYFDTLKEKLYRKLKILAFVEANNKKLNNIEYFKYIKMTVYLIKDFDTFLSLLEQGVIRTTFKVNVVSSGTRKGTIRDHGTGFDIKEKDLNKLYDIYIKD